EFAFDVVASNADGAAEPATFELDVVAPPTIEGAETAVAQINVPFTYTPTVDAGTPVSFFGVRGLPSWAAVNPYTGEIWGTPTGALGDFVGTYETYYGTEPDPEHAVVITVVAGAASELFLTPERATVAQGRSVAFSVTATDVEGNLVDVSDRIVLSSSVATDVVDGLTVTFPTASSHVITVTDIVTGVTDVATVEVVAAAGSGGSQGTLP
ncbi:hypothetical protein, partial [Burkholderia cenocepacia]|uniref:hypothetical protein n=1 Tax=Burkholderia cenocepacia TaxID=95486 RepID=UPI0038CC1DDC